MKKENALLILWIIFGFVIVQMINSVLYILIYLIFLLEIKMGIEPMLIKIITPIISIGIYLFSIIFLSKVLKINSKSEGIYLSEFPQKLFLIFFVMTILLIPISNYLLVTIIPKTAQKEMEIISYVDSKAWVMIGIALSKFSSILLLFAIFRRKLKLIEKEK